MSPHDAILAFYTLERTIKEFRGFQTTLGVKIEHRNVLALYTHKKSSPVGLFLEFKIWRLKVITDLITW